MNGKLAGKLRKAAGGVELSEKVLYTGHIVNSKGKKVRQMISVSKGKKKYKILKKVYKITRRGL